MSRKLILFDFDGTITYRDTFPLFISFSRGKFKMLLGFIFNLGAVVSYFLDKKKGGELKRKILAWHFAGSDQLWLQKKGEEFIEYLFSNNGFRKEFMDVIADEKRNGNLVCIVSASIDVWIKPFARKMGIEYICTPLKFSNGKFTGEFLSPNCNNEEKRRRILDNYKLQDFEKIIAYGNSDADNEMFSLADEVIRI